jgi:ketosteroid isomerase-like protein
MIKKVSITIVTVSLLLITNHCTNQKKRIKIDKSDEIDLIEKAIHGSIGWAKNKDFKLLYSVIANDSNYLEVDPNPEIIKGFDEFKKNEVFWGNPNFKAIRYEIRDLKISISECGTVAWYYCVLDDINEWKGKPAEWRDTRWTGVLENREGRWVIVQMHFSFAQEQNQY